MIADALIALDPRYPTVGAEARRNLEQIKRDLEAQAPAGAAPDPFESDDPRR